MKCLQIHNDYIIPGGETTSTKLIANLLEENNIEVIRFYKDNKSLQNNNKMKMFLSGVKSIYNLDVTKEIQQIINENKIDFALIHNTSPIISNSIYNVLCKNKIPIIKYVQNYNLLCLNGAKDKSINICSDCVNKDNFVGVKNKCYKNSIAFTAIKYLNKKIFDKFYKNKINKYIAISNFIKKNHINSGFDKEQIEIMYHFVNKIEPNIENYKNYYLYYGRLSEEKGLKTLVNVFKNNSNINLYIMGNGPLEEEIKNVIKKNDIKNIKMLGYMTGSEKENYIKNAYCTIIPSEWDEPFGRVVIESYSYGTPVIGSDRGGITELIVDNKTGFIFKNKSEESLFEKIEILQNIERMKYIEVRKECVKACLEQFSKESYIDKFTKIVSNL